MPTTTGANKVKTGGSPKSKKKAPAPQFDSSWLETVSSGNETARQPTDEHRFAEFANYLVHRKSPLPLHRLFPGSQQSPLFWGSPREITAQVQSLRLTEGTKLLKQRRHAGEEPFNEWVGEWLAKADQRALNSAYALEALAWAHALPQLASRLSAASWWDLMQHFRQVGGGRLTLDVARRDVWVGQLLAVELPLTLAYLLPELPDAEALRWTAARCLNEALRDLLDGQGMPHADHFPQLLPLFACWTRSISLCRAMEKRLIDKEAHAQYDWLVQNVLRVLRADLCGPLTEPNPNRGYARGVADLLETALDIAGDEADAALASLVLQTNGICRGASVDDKDLPDEPGYQSDWSELAVLQPDWHPDGPRLTVLHANGELRGELIAAGQTIFSSVWTPAVEINGQRLNSASEWEAVTWSSDDDVDFLELQIELTGGWVLERQMLMARQDLFCYLADVLTGPNSAEIHYWADLPLEPSVTFQMADETRDGYLHNKRRLGLVLPLSLPEWQLDRSHGALRENDAGHLEYTQRVTGTALCAPLFIDLHPRRMRKTPTWRNLTVGQDLDLLSADQAVGYRVQVGPEQWLFFRSLTPCAPDLHRTVLGQHLSCEFLAARFLNDGTVEQLIEISGEV